MAIIRDITPAPDVPYLTDVTVTDMPDAAVANLRALSRDRTTIYGVRSSSLIQSTDDGKTWTVIKDFSPMAGTLAAVVILNNGELLVSEKSGGWKGGAYLSTGFAQASPTAATWARVKMADGSDLTVSRNDNVIHDAWGYSIAPAGHVRDGLVALTEYGGQSSTADADTLSPKVWLSLDHGKTFKVIADLFTVLGSRVNQHMHGILYDPWFDVILCSYGDGNGSGAKTGIFQISDFATPTPKITHIHQTNSANFQATTMFACEGGVIMGGDGAPCGIYRLPRRSFRVWGKLQTVLNYGGGTGTGLIGQRIHQNGPGAPIIMSSMWTKPGAGVSHPLWLSFNGEEFYEIFRDSTPAMEYPSINAVGPTRSGKLVMTMSGDKRTASNRSLITGSLTIP